MGVSNLIINTLNCPDVVKVISMGSVLIVIGFGLKVITKISDIQMEHGNVAASASLKMISTLVHYMGITCIVSWCYRWIFKNNRERNNYVWYKIGVRI